MAQIKRPIYAGILLALLLVFQSLRSFLPLPPFFSTLLIGTLVNATFIITIEQLGNYYAVVLACVAPIVAYVQQLLLLPVFIPVVALGNIIYILVYGKFKQTNRWGGLLPAAGLKTLWLYGAFYFLVQWLPLPSFVSKSLLVAMSWPQMATAVAGGVLAWFILKRIKKSLSFLG